jgi:hypothetical protein
MSMEEQDVARIDPVEAAIAIHDRFGVVHPWDIDVELFAAEHGFFTLYRDAASHDARVVQSEGRTYFVLAKEAEGTPRALFSLGHEFGHGVCDRGVDCIDRIHGGARPAHEYPVEGRADKFSTELLLPRKQLGVVLATLEPVLVDVKRLARRHNTSITCTGRRWAKLSPQPCALVRSSAGIVTNVWRSTTFRSKVVKGHAVPPSSAAARLARGEARDGAVDLATGAWESAMRRYVREESLAIAGTPVVLSWLWQQIQR